MKALMYLHKYSSSSQKVELAWPKRMLSPDLEMSNVRLGLLMTYVASMAIFPRFHPSTLPRAAASERRGILKALLNGCLRMHFESLFERDLETESVITGVSGSVAAFAGRRAARLSPGPAALREPWTESVHVSPPAPPTARPLTTWLVLTVCDEFLHIGLFFLFH